MNPSGMATSDEAAHEDYDAATSDEEREARLISSLEESLVKELNLSESSYEWLTKHSDFRLRLTRSIGRCQSLESVRFWAEMTVPELELLCEGLCQNKVLKCLTIRDSPGLGDEGSIKVCKMLAENETLTYLDMSGSNVSATGASSFEWMLASNSTLKTLTIGRNPLYAEGVRALLRPLTAREGHRANTSLTALMFYYNQMGAEGAAAVALMLRNNHTLLDLRVCDDDSIGEQDVCSIIESLKDNISLEHLDLSGCEGVRGSVFPAIMDLLQVNTWLKVIGLVNTPLQRNGQEKAIRAQLARNAHEYNTSDEAAHEDYDAATSDEGREARLISLLERSLVKELNLSESSYKWLTKHRNFRLRLARSIGRCQSLKRVEFWHGMMVPELELLCEGLCQNKALESLSIDNSPGLGDEGSIIVCKMLAENETLTHLDMWGSNVSATGASSFEWMLASNSTLEILALGRNPLYAEGVRALLRPLTAREEGHQGNTSLTALMFYYNQMGAEGAADVALMLRNNHTLLELRVCDDDSIGEQEVCSIIESLKDNKSLEHLDLRGCEGVRGSLFPAIMDLLQVNTWLKVIGLVNTPLQRDGQEKAIRAQLARNAAEYNEVLREMTRTRPTSARVFLCGHAYSGKTTLARSMPRSLATKLGNKLKNKILERFESQEADKGFKKDPMEWATRTRGIEIKLLVDDANHKISIWDLAGQEEYHAFHDFMIPDLSTQGSPCSFLLLCNPFLREGDEKPINDIKKELSYWLRFIASNTRRSIKFQPQVAVVLTHCDKTLDGTKQDQFADCVEDLKKDFAPFINISSKFYTVNARRSSKVVRELVEDLKVTCSSVLKNLPKVYEACQDMRGALLEWNMEHPDQPLITKDAFNSELIQKKIRSLKKYGGFNKETEQLVDGRRVAVVQSLHEVGEVIYFTTEEFVVVNPKWFCHEIMGHLINLNTHVETTKLESDFVNGFADKKHLERLLQRSLKPVVDHLGNGSTGLPIKSLVVYLIQLMLKLDLCYESHQASALNSKVFIPTMLKHDEDVVRGERRLQWEVRVCNMSNPIIIYLGRRLQCSERELTTLTPGFFPKLQVILHNHFKDSEFTNKKNLMRIILDRMEILVELSGDMMGYLFIDIMVKSWKNRTVTLDIVDDRVVRQIQELCNSPHGCQGVVLVESILRPDCVQELVSCKYRWDQAVIVETLKKNFLATGSDPKYTHTWKKVEGPYELGASFDEATHLLGEKDTGNVLDRRIAELVKVESYVESQLASSQPNLAHPRAPLQQVTSFEKRLEIWKNEIIEEVHVIGDRVIQEVSKKVEVITRMEKSLVEKIYKKLDATINLSLQLQERQVPCNVYFTTKGTSQQRQLIIKLIPGFSVIQLHLLCEHQHGIHVVKNQEGLTITLATEVGEKYIRPLIISGLTIFNLLLKVGAHTVAGIGDMVPNFGRGIALALDTQSLSEYLPTFTDALDPLRVSGRVNEKTALIVAPEKQAAEQWLVNYLRAPNINISKSFGLWRIRYTEEAGCNNNSTRQGPQLRWVCKGCREKGLRDHSLVDCPI